MVQRCSLLKFGPHRWVIGGCRNVSRTALTSTQSQSAYLRRLSCQSAPRSQQARLKLWRPALVLGAVSGGTAAYNLLSAEVGNDSFVAYKLVNKEKVSSTASILTLERQDVTGNSNTFKDVWKKGVWNVQIKQPDIQIVRPYTPLPPLEPEGKDETAVLRFLIRKENHGEVSSYLHRLPIGSTIEARGPYIEYELPPDVKKILFLAGGTGITPALQTAHAFLDNSYGQHCRLHIIWTNRKREDCVGGYDTVSTSPSTNSGYRPSQQGFIVQQLNQLQQNHPGQIIVEYLVDEENSVLDEKLLSKSLARLNQALSPKDGNEGDHSLILVSGPEGFIKHVAGPKVWMNGRYRQGEIGGLLSQELAKSYQNWKVRKI